MALAIDGGAPVRSTPLPPWPVFAEDEIAAVEAVLRSGKVNYWTGDEGRELEREYAASLGRERAIVVANGTVSLELLLRAHGVQPGDEVVTTPRTFMASASSIVAVGGVPVFADVDRDSGNVTAETIARVLTPRTRAVLPVHLAGWPCEMDPIMALADAHGLAVVEDCAQAHGGSYRGRPIGALGHSASFSFCQDKILTTGGEGGLIATDDDAVWRAAWAFKDHGKSYEAYYEREHPPGYRWLIESFGSNYRMSEMQAAIGRVILRKLPAWSARRRANADILRAAMAPFAAVRVPTAPDHMTHAEYKLYAYVEPDALAAGWDRDRIMAAINAEGVPCFSGSCSEIYREKAFDGMRPDERLPVARELGDTSLMFLVHPTITDEDAAEYATAITKVLEAATR